MRRLKLLFGMDYWFRGKLISLALIPLTFMGCASNPGEQNTPLSNPATQSPTLTNLDSTLTIGDISSEPAKVIEAYQPLADLLAVKLQSQGIKKGEVKVASSLKQMQDFLRSGEVDVYFDSVYPALTTREATGAKILMRRWKKGVGEYTTIIFTLPEQNITNLQDLVGKRIGFDLPYSTSGFFLPMATLLDAGLKPYQEGKKAPQDNSLEYIFTQDDENTIQWVISKKVAAGAVDSQTFSEIPNETRQKMRKLAETKALPRQLVVVRPGMKQESLKQLEATLLTLHESSEGKSVLETFEKTTKFDLLPPNMAVEVLEEWYESVQKSIAEG